MSDSVGDILRHLFISGLERFGRYYSSYRAVVYDNDDKDGYNRLRLVVPQFDRKIPYTNWAWAKGNFSGKDYGLNMLPQKGDLVWVEFEHGDPNRPIWSHGYFTKNEKPKEFDSPQTFGFKSPYGFVITLKDADKKITITTPKNLSIEFDDNEETVSIRNSKGNIYQLGKNESLNDAGGNSIIHQKDGLIYLGKEAKESGTLGDETEKRLNELTDLLDELSKIILQWTTTDAAPLTAIGATGTATALPKMTLLVPKIITLKAKIVLIKSKVIKLQ